MRNMGISPRAGRSITWKATSPAAFVACVALGLPTGLLVVATPADAAVATDAPKPVLDPKVPKILTALKGNGVSDTDWGDVDASGAPTGVNAAGAWAPARDLGSMYSLTAGYGMQSAWSKGVTGKGVTVAVIDTGIAPVAGLDAAGKVVNGPDLSYDGQAVGTRYVDGYGHGTHMAGIIAGRDPGFDPKHPSADQFDGVAPDAQLLNMKVGAADGGADVSQVIAALDWVVAHKSDHGMNVRVINLAYGTESVQPWQIDPLARAVENAWAAGIVVVAAAGNDGLAAPSLLMPAVDPHVIAVGAVDNEGTASRLDDQVADFTSGGNAARRPDVLAPGKSLVSLRVPGSYVDTMHPEGLVAGDASGRFFRGSGTSQATAVTAGEVALLLQARPSLTPNQVKALLMTTADPLELNPSPVMGAGVTDVSNALVWPVMATRATAALPTSTGNGSLEASRGGEHVIDPTSGVELVGEVDALGSAWNGAAWAAASSAGTSWVDGSWNGRAWAGTGWSKDGYSAVAWTGPSFDGTAWQDHTWSTSTWLARSWRNDGWEARSWREESWSARTWREDGWSARSWRSLS